MISPRLRRWLMIAGLVNFGALFSTSASVNKELLDRGDVHLWRTLFDEFTGYNTILILLPATVALMARFPIRKTNWARTVPIHLGGSLVFAVAHTTLMTLVRTPLYPAFGLGHYEVGDPLVRFGLEYHKQFLGYCLTYGIVAFVTYYRSTREEYERAAQLRLQTEHLKAELADARLAALERQIQPHFLFNTLNTISSVMYEDLDTADRMISNLSALLRMSLERAEDPKIPLRGRSWRSPSSTSTS
ncbi:MAG: histidine kinase [Deltaproteobacteria bacterium]|nr:histidine kinase [Deltaproteobacteria bacterium]